MWHETLCPTCLGAGEERFKSRDLHPAFNVAHCEPATVGGEAGYRRACRDCDGAGFRPIKSLPPLIAQEDSAGD